MLPFGSFIFLSNFRNKKTTLSLYVNRSSSIHRTKSCYPQYIPTTQYFMHSDHPIKKFEILQFVYQNALAILLFFAFIKFFFPSIWEVQVTASAGVFIMTLLVVHMVMGFVEFFYINLNCKR